MQNKIADCKLHMIDVQDSKKILALDTIATAMNVRLPSHPVGANAEALLDISFPKFPGESDELSPDNSTNNYSTAGGNGSSTKCS